MTKTILSILTAAVLGLTLQGCGDDGRPSKGELADALKDIDGINLTDDQADCLAGEVIDSDLSDEELNKLKDNDADDATNAKLGTIFAAAIETCKINPTDLIPE